MAKWYTPLLLSSLLCLPCTATAHTECEKLFTSIVPIKRQKQFINDRDRLISHFSPDRNATVIADVIRHSTAAGSQKVVKNALWLVDVPAEVIRHASLLGLTKKRAREVAADLKSEIEILEKKAICYHFKELEHYHGDRLMMLKLYDNVTVEEADTSTPPIAFGYFTTTTDGNSSRVIHLTYPGDCANRECHFTNIDKSDFRGTGIRLVHHPEVVETMTTGLSNVAHGDPLVTDLTGLELAKTGEIFTSPEIYAAVYYYGEDIDIDKKSYDRRMLVDIPWALKKGANYGRTRLLTWHNQTRAHIVIMEDDRDIPFADIQNVIKLGFKAAVELLPAGNAVINFAEALDRVINFRDPYGDEKLVALLESWQKNDFIDELVLERRFNQNMAQPGVKGTATLRLSNMYWDQKPVPEPEVVTPDVSAPPKPDEIAIDTTAAVDKSIEEENIPVDEDEFDDE